MKMDRFSQTRRNKKLKDNRSKKTLEFFDWKMFELLLEKKKILYRLLKSYKKKKKMRKKLETDDFIKSKFNNNFVSDMS